MPMKITKEYNDKSTFEDISREVIETNKVEVYNKDTAQNQKDMFINKIIIGENQENKIKIIDLALKYGYESADSITISK